MRFQRLAGFFLLVAALLLPLLVSAQSDTGSITGFVRDPSGAVVPRAKVLIRNEGTKDERTVDTNEGGYYVMTNLLPGFYTVQVEAGGFKKTESVHNKLDANTTLSVEIALQIGATSESVEVTATGVNMQTESAAVEKLVTRSEIDALELNGRDPLFLA